MPGHLSTPIIVTVILWYVVHVVEDEAVPVQVLHRFPKANVEEHGTVEGLGSSLAGGKFLSRGVPAVLLCVCSQPCLENSRGQLAPILAPKRSDVLGHTSEINQH